jgi:hypothetical protein
VKRKELERRRRRRKWLSAVSSGSVIGAVKYLKRKGLERRRRERLSHVRTQILASDPNRNALA